MSSRFALAAASASAALLLVTGCAAVDPSSSSASAGPVPASPGIDSDAPAAAGVREVAEPALHLTTVAPDGVVTHLDLEDGRSTEIAHIAPADDVITDGRYLFALRDGSVTIVDSGAWTWSHGDHFHFYRGAARVVGEVSGDGTPSVTPGDRSVGIRFDGGEAVLVKAAPLADGDVEELFRVPAESGPGLVVPLAYGAWVTDRTNGLREIDEDGVDVGVMACADPRGTIATVVGVVVSCGDEALLAVDGRPAKAERLALASTAEPLTGFTGRKGRPTVSSLAASGEIRLLDTRARTGTAWMPPEPLASVVAVGDSAGTLVGVTTDGDVAILEEDGAVRAPVDANVGTDAALVPEQRRTFVIEPDGEVLVVDHATGAVTDRFSVPAGSTVLTGR